MITVNPGLYHKLHGVSRPGKMKKTIIKRRKRVVVPPNGSLNSMKRTPTVSITTDSFSTAGDTVPQNDESALRQLFQHISNVVNMEEEDADMLGGDRTAAASQQSIAVNTAISTYGPRIFPPPIDFTSSFRSQASAPGTGNVAPTVSVVTATPTYHSHEGNSLAPIHHPNSSGLNQPLPRKRSVSVSSGGGNEDSSANPQRLNSISSILNPRSGSSNMDIPIEPSLLGLSANGIGEERQRIYDLREKRLRLMCEQKRLREEIEALDKELTTVMPLGGGGSGVVTQDARVVAVDHASALTARWSGDRGGDNTGTNGTIEQNQRVL